MDTKGQSGATRDQSISLNCAPWLNRRPFCFLGMDGNYRSRGGHGSYGGGGRGGGRGRSQIPKADRGVYDGKSKRPMIVRKAVDFQSDAITYVTVRTPTTLDLIELLFCKTVHQFELLCDLT